LLEPLLRHSFNTTGILSLVLPRFSRRRGNKATKYAGYPVTSDSTRIFSARTRDWKSKSRITYFQAGNFSALGTGSKYQGLYQGQQFPRRLLAGWRIFAPFEETALDCLNDFYSGTIAGDPNYLDKRA
jgi:hypothetical protein